MALPRRRRGQRNSTSPDIVVAVRHLVLIASILNRNKLTTGLDRKRVTTLRSHHRSRSIVPPQTGVEPWLNLNKAAAHLRISAKTLRLRPKEARSRRYIRYPDRPWIFSCAILDGNAAKAVADRARQRTKYPAGFRPDQQNLFSSTS